MMRRAAVLFAACLVTLSVCGCGRKQGEEGGKQVVTLFVPCGMILPFDAARKALRLGHPKCVLDPCFDLVRKGVQVPPAFGPPITGVVLRVNPEVKAAVIDKGKKAGVKPNMPFTIFNDSGMVATLVNSLTIAAELAARGLPARVLCAFGVSAVAERYRPERAREVLRELGNGVAVEGGFR